MLRFDQNGEPTRESAFSLAGYAGPSQVLDELAREIEETQRGQSETLSHIVDKLRSIATNRMQPAPTQRPAAPTSRERMTLEEAGDEPWDTDTADALLKSYEARDDDARGADAANGDAYGQRAWIGERFNDVTQKITHALSSMQSGSTVTLLEERLDAFQTLIAEALRDVVRREDLDGMRVIEQHVNELGDKLDELERHVSRIDGIENDMRNVIEQVSDERINKLFDYDSRFSADIEAVAKRAAEEVHNRMTGGDGHELGAGSRHDELRSLIEASIRDRREADVQAASLVSGLSGRVNEQSDRYDELKDILQQAIQEQRQNEQTAFGMLDTLQQALVTILDRMDALELNQHTAALAPVQAAPAARSEFVEHPYSPLVREEEPEALDASGEVRYTFRDTRYDFSGVKEPRETPPPLKPTESYFEESVEETSEPAPYAVSEDAESAVEKLRRDFVADARRAKLKAAANRAEEVTSEKTGTGVGSVSQTRASLVQSFRSPESSGSGRIFGMSTKLLAGVLALIIAINGGLLILNRKSAPPPAPAISHSSETPPEASNKQDHQADLPNPGPRSDLGHGALPPYGLNDDILNPPEVETLGSAIPSEPPSGMTVTGSEDAVPAQAVAEVYEQQVLAGLSGQLGMIAAGQSADAMLPEKSGRIDATYTPAPVPGSAGPAASGALDLPPATVGPMSLRLAAANGDASAEFEVAARLAEGKGTGQNYAEALRWYQRSAAKGFAQSQYRLGTLYERGLGVEKDIERAKIWYSRAAEQGNVKAMHNLAVLNASGDAPNFAAAAPWFLKAAEYGLADSQYNLGVLLENGLAGKTDPVAAYKWYALAAKGGDKDATERKDAMRSQLAKQDLTAAEDLVASFRARPASPLANDARTAGEDWKKRVTDTNT